MKAPAGKVFSGRFSRAERAQRRSRINLDDAALGDKTRERYYLALRKLLDHVGPCDELFILDAKACDWIRKMWREGEPLLTIGDALSALHYYEPSTKRGIPHSWKLFSVWRKVEIPSRAPPLTWYIVQAFASFELKQGNLEMAASLMLGFHCLLRTGELLSLTLDDFSLSATQGICSLIGTKSGKRNAANEVITICNPLVLLILTQLIEIRRLETHGNNRLYSASSACFRKRFNFLCHKFGLDSFVFRPYSLRRGGATAFFQETQSMEATLIRGRWESSRVARIYITDGLSFLPSLKMTDYSRSLLERFQF